jgi:hypothetical protein
MDDFEVTELDQRPGEEDAPGPNARFQLSESPTPARDPLAPRRARRVRGLVALGLMLLLPHAPLADAHEQSIANQIVASFLTQGPPSGA